MEEERGSMRTRDKNLLSIIFIGVISGILVFGFGFLVMNFLWEISIKNPALRGFDIYLAAYWGDRICLPILVGCGIVFILYHSKISKKSNIICFSIGLIMALLAIIIQTSWLLSDYTVLNWTIPKLHYFNFAGWYHAFFFVIMFFIVGFIMAKIWFIRHMHRDSSIQEEIIFVMIVAAGSGFVYLNGIDNYSEKFGFLQVLITMYLGTILVTTLFCVTSRKNTLYKDLFIIISGASISLGIVIICLFFNINIGHLLLSITAALFSILFIKPDCKKPINSKLRFLLLAFPTFFLNYAFFITMDISLSYFCIMLSLSIMTPIIMGRCIQENRKVNLGNFIAMCLAPTYIVIPIVIRKIYVTNIGELVEGLVTLAAYVLSKEHISNKLFNIVIENENKIESSTTQDKNTKNAVYFNIIMIALGNFIYLAMLLVWTSQRMADNLTIEIPGWKENNLLLVFLLGSIVIILALLKNINRNNIKVVMAISFIILGYIFLAFLLYIVREPLFIDWRVVFLIFPVLGSSLMLSKGYYANMVELCGRKGKRDEKVISCIIFVGTLVNSTLAVLPSYKISNCLNNPILYFMYSIVGILFAYMFLPALISRAFNVARRQTNLIRSDAMSGVLQDGVMTSLIIIIAGLIPVYYSLVSNRQWTNLIGGILMLFIAISWPCSYCLKNNQDHYKRKCEEYSLLRKDKTINISILDRQMKALKELLVFQNLCTYFSALPYLLVHDIWQMISNNISSKQMLDNTILHYAFIQPEVILKLLHLTKHQESKEADE